MSKRTEAISRCVRSQVSKKFTRRWNIHGQSDDELAAHHMIARVKRGAREELEKRFHLLDQIHFRIFRCRVGYVIGPSSEMKIVHEGREVQQSRKIQQTRVH